MSFWGVEVKPGKPYTHIHDNIRGPLRLSQVTLGDGVGAKRSVLQCNVGDRSPVLLCSLLPDKAECCGMDLQFEESYEVIFSVVGPRSVHLAGYFVDISSKRRPPDADDSDSFGEDIGETGSEESGDHGSDDRYESDFIDDSDGPIDEKMSNGNGNHQRMRRKHRISDSDEGDEASQHQMIIKPGKPPVSESEDDDFFPTPFSASKKDKEQKLAAPVNQKNDAISLKEDISEGEDRTGGIASEKSKKRKKEKTNLLNNSPVKDRNIPDERTKDRSCEDPIRHGDGKRDEIRPHKQGKEELNPDGSHSDENNGKLKKRKKSRDRKGENSKSSVDHGSKTILAENSMKSKSTKKEKVGQADALERDTDLSEEANQIETVAPEIASSSLEDSRTTKRKKNKTKGEISQNKEKQKLRKDNDDPLNTLRSMDIVTDSIIAPSLDVETRPRKGKSRRKKGSH